MQDSHKKDIKVIECFDPANNQKLGEVPVNSPKEVLKMVEESRVAQKEWVKANFSKRRKVLQDLMDVILQNDNLICQNVVKDAGKTIENAMLGEIWPVCEKIKWTIEHGAKYLKAEKVPAPNFPHKRAMIEYHPRGVIGIISPWNYPFQNILGPVIPALMAGNACVVKVSEFVAWSSESFKPLLQEVLTKNGFSPDLIQIVQGYAKTGKALAQAPVDLIVFTGSMPNGRKIIESSVDNITPVILELGGKDPMIICDDADIDVATNAALHGAFIACGQNCLAAERVFVFDDIYDEFLKNVTQKVSYFKQGHPLEDKPIDVGAIVSPLQLGLIDELVQDAKKKGATVICGGHKVLEDKGQFFAPTILTNVTSDMRIANEETFGPVLLVFKIEGIDEEDKIESVIQKANNVPYGLSSSVFSRDKKKATYIAKRLEAGSTCVNDFAITYMAQHLPFGGIKGSGFGRLNGRDGIRAMCHQKAVLYDKYSFSPTMSLYPTQKDSYKKYRKMVHTLVKGSVLDKIKLGFSLWQEGKKENNKF